MLTQEQYLCNDMTSTHVEQRFEETNDEQHQENDPEDAIFLDDATFLLKVQG